METIAGSMVLVLALVMVLAFYFLREAKLDLLLKQGGMTYEPLGGSTEVEDALTVGVKVRAISLYRASNSCTLAEAKAIAAGMRVDGQYHEIAVLVHARPAQ